MRSGHIPISVNLPCSALVDANGKFKTVEVLDTLFADIGVDLANAPNSVITTCGSGITACTLALALHTLGYHSVAIYDGSWSEWGLEDVPTTVVSAP